MTERIRYEHIDEQLVGARLAGLQHTDELLSEPQRADLQLLNDELRRDPAPIGFVAWVPETGAIVLGLGQALRGLPTPDGPLTPDEVAERRARPIDAREMTGYLREVGIGPGGWIEVADD